MLGLEATTKVALGVSRTERVGHRPGSVAATPARTPRGSVKELARLQAAALRDYLAEHAHQLPVEVLAEDLIDTHDWLCGHYGWRPRPWQAVAAQLRTMTGGRKCYRWFERDGVMHRLRVYPVPRAAASTPASAPMPTPMPAARVDA